MNTNRLTNPSIKLGFSFALMFVITLSSFAQTFNGSAINTAANSLIPSTGTGGCAVAPQTTGGTIFNNTVAGLPANAYLMQVLVNFTHTFDADIDMYLVAPNGQIIELSTDNGAGGDDYTNTIFDDAAAINITAGAPPFTGTFRPEGTLTAEACGTTVTPNVTTLGGFSPGQNGVWTLVIKDDLGADVGTMLNWSLTFIVCQPLTVDPVSNQTVCNGSPTTAVNFSGSVPGTVFTWTNNNTSIGLAASGTGNIASFTATNATNAPVTATITVTPTFPGCPNGPSTTFTITVNPTPTVNPVSNQTVCSGAPTAPVTFTGPVAGTNFNWTNNTPSIGLAGSGTGNIASFNAINLTNAPVTATITVTPSTGVASASTVAVTGFVNNNSNATILFNFRNNNAYPVTVTGIESICSTNGLKDVSAYYKTSAINGLPGAISVANGWNQFGAAVITGIANTTTATTQPFMSGLTLVVPAGATYGICVQAVNQGTTTAAQRYSTIAAGTYTFSTAGCDIVTGTNIGYGGAAVPAAPANTPRGFMGKITFTAPGAGTFCPGPTTSFNITVNPTPVVNPVASRTVCNGSTVPAVNFSGSVPGTVFNWTNSNTSIGLGASGTGNLPSFTATNATTAPITGTITVTPTYTNVVTCVGTPITFTITVAPTSTVDPVPNQTVCNGSLTAPVNFTSPVAGTTFAWINNTTSIGLGASGTGNIAAFTAINATTLPVTATVTVTPSYTIGSPGSITLPAQTGTFTGNVRGYWFTAPTSFTMTSLFVPTDASTGNQSIAVVRFTGAVPPPVFPTTTNAFTTLFLTQNNPAAGPIPVSIPIVAGDVIAIMGYRATINSYSAGPNNIIIAGLPVSLVRMGMQFPLTTTAPQNLWQEPASSSISRVLFDYTTAVSCSGTPRSFTITVNPTPTITCPANITVPSVLGACNAAVNYTPVVTGTPAPTLTYSFSGATTGSGNGSGSGSVFNVGVTTVTLTATNICGTVSCSFTITVTDSQLPVISQQPSNQTVCTGSNASFSVVSSNALNYQWQAWNGSVWGNIAGATSPTLTLNAVTFSMNTNSYRVLVIGLCTTVTSSFATLYVNALPTISLLASGPLVLLPAQSVTLTAVVSPGGGSYQWFKNGVAIAGATGASLAGLTVDDIGSYTCRYTDLNGCVATSAAMVVSGQVSDGLFIYPVPNNGYFHVRFYNQAGEEATVRVFDMRGALVYQKKVTTTLPYTDIDIDMRNRITATGTYLVEVRGGDGRLIGAKKIIVYK